MTTSRHRKVRGAETQRVVAGYLAGNGWPYATDAGAGRNGADILGVPGLAIEVKARRDFRVLEWVRQASRDGGVPLVVHRPDGMGPATVADWPVTTRLSVIVRLLRQAGYGNPLDEDSAVPDVDGVELDERRTGAGMIHIKLTEVTVSLLPETDINHHLYAVKVEYRGDEKYAVLHHGWCLDADGRWEYEPRPSSRDDDWLARYRFDYDTAHRMAIDVAPTVEVNGLTAAEIAARYEQ